MPLLVTDAIVLHAFDYLESSRILRLMTREAGVQSVLAKGARRSSRRFGSAVDLFAEGSAQLYLKPGRDLHTLAAFEVTNARHPLACDLGRFAGASALSELVLRFGRDAADADLYDSLVRALDAVVGADPARARQTALAGAWQLVGELGFAPTLDQCASCHAAIQLDRPALFSHPAGGALCERCARLAGVGRAIPSEARAAIRAWTTGAEATLPDVLAVRAHQRLLREFLREHLTDGRPLQAFESWERDDYAAALPERDLS